MNLLLGFAPFLLFAIVCHVWGALPGLMAGALAAGALVARELLCGRSAKLLEVGTALLFGGLGAYTLAAGVEWSVMGMRLAVDIGLLLLVLGSIIAGRPFTLQYARERAGISDLHCQRWNPVNGRLGGKQMMGLLSTGTYNPGVPDNDQSISRPRWPI